MSQIALITPLVAEAAEWRTLGLLFERPRPGWHAEVARLAEETQSDLLHQAAAAAGGAREETYLALFGPGRRLSPREVTYLGFDDPGQSLADVRSFYEAFLFTPRTEEPADHVSVEAAFIGFLCLRQAYALLDGEPQAAAACKDARQRFIADHLSRIARGLAGRVPADAPRWVIQVAEALRLRVDHNVGHGAAGAVS